MDNFLEGMKWIICKVYILCVQLCTGRVLQCCREGVGAGGAEIICDLEPEPKLDFYKKFTAVSLENARMKKKTSIETYFL